MMTEHDRFKADNFDAASAAAESIARDWRACRRAAIAGWATVLVLLLLRMLGY
jgi:hypothetical protein